MSGLAASLRAVVYFPDMRKVKGDRTPDMNIREVLNMTNMPESSAMSSMNLVTNMMQRREMMNAMKHDFRYLVYFIAVR